MAEGGATQSARLLLRRFSNYKWIVQNFNLHSRGRPLAPFVGALDSRRFSTRRPVILFLPIKHFSFYATAALRTSSMSVRYEIASAKCTRETVAVPSRSASVRATRSTRV
jgi:hypothetical protein